MIVYNKTAYGDLSFDPLCQTALCFCTFLLLLLLSFKNAMNNLKVSILADFIETVSAIIDNTKDDAK